MKYSIIVPAYNEEQKISNVVQSILDQSFKNFELIVIDDGSTDATLKKINEIKDSRLKVLTKENEGVSSARNLGIRKAKGKYIIFVDADDNISKNLLLNIDKEIKNEKNVYWIFRALINRDGMKKEKKVLSNFNEYLKIEENISFLLETEFINSPWGKVYEKDLLLKNQIFFDERLRVGEDLLFNLDYLNQCESLVFLDAGFYIYNINKNSLTSDFNEINYQSVLRMHELIRSRDYYKNYQIAESLKYIELKNDLSYLNWNCKDKNKFLRQYDLIKKKKYKNINSKKMKSMLFLINNFNAQINRVFHRIIYLFRNIV